MDNPNVILDEEDEISEEEHPETIRLRPYYDWRSDTPSVTDFPRVSSQVPLSPKIFTGDDMFGYELEIENDEEDDDDDDDEDATNGTGLKRSLSIRNRGTLGRGSVKKKAPKDRGTWQGKFDFILSLIGYSVGLGNVWRFPYLVYSNGGGAFLIPFIIMMLIVGFPLMFMELAFGQYASLSPVVIFKRFSPLFAGIGYGMIAVSGIVMLYYNMIIAWTLYYMYASLSSELPWSRCDPSWSSTLCYSYKEKDDCIALDPNATYYNRTCFNAEQSRLHNLSHLVLHAEKKAPADEYFNNFVLGNINTIEQTGSVQWHLMFTLFLAWLLVFACLSKGVQSSGKVVYFTALFPYVVLVILFVRGITLPGAMEGIMFYLKPDFSHLFVAQVWGDAAVQVFFALSPAWGGLITLASYNKFDNNCFKDSILVLVANAGTSIFSGFVVFSIIGYLAHELELPVNEVVNQGVGLAFMVYPEVVARLPISPLWSFLFFFMLITLGLDSQFALLETVQTAILDRFPKCRNHKILTLLMVSTVGYIGGVIFTTQSGILWLGLFDKYAANFSVSIIAITECVLIAWYYGTERFIRDIEKMIGVQSETWKKVWTLMWKYVTPCTLMFILIFNWIKIEPPESDAYVYPQWANIFGWILAFVPTAIIVLTMLHTYCTYTNKNKSLLQTINALMQPSESWGPTHKNIERLQRRESKIAARNNSKRLAMNNNNNDTIVSTGTVCSNNNNSINNGKLPTLFNNTVVTTNGNSNVNGHPGTMALNSIHQEPIKKNSNGLNNQHNSINNQVNSNSEFAHKQPSTPPAAAVVPAPTKPASKSPLSTVNLQSSPLSFNNPNSRSISKIETINIPNDPKPVLPLDGNKKANAASSLPVSVVVIDPSDSATSKSFDNPSFDVSFNANGSKQAKEMPM